MRKLILCILAAGVLAVAAQQPAAPVKSPEPTPVAIDSLTFDDAIAIIRQLGGELAEARLSIKALHRQAHEWQIRALAAESRLEAQAKRVVPPAEKPTDPKRDSP